MKGNAVQPSRAGTVARPQGVVARYVTSGAWEQRPLAEYVVAAADAAPDQIALVDGDLRMTYRELVARADGAALRLRQLGLHPDDRLVIQLPNCWEYVILTLACLRLGVIPVMALVAHRKHEMSYLARFTEARGLVVPGSAKDYDHQAMAGEIANGVASVDHVLVAGGDNDPPNLDLDALCRPAAEPALARSDLDDSAPDSGATAMMLLSGGTTGMPKLIPRDHNEYGCVIRHIRDVCGLGPDTVCLVVLPFGHGWPLSSILATLLAGGRLVIAASPDPAKVFATIERERATVAAIVPAIAQRWLDYRESDASHDLSSLDLLAVGGSRLPDHVAPRIVPTLARTLQQAYGMSEGLVCSTRLDDPAEVVHHTQGRPICPEDEIRLVDELGKPVGVGEPGLLLTRGPSTLPGYYRAEKYNSEAFLGDGWFSTGDIVRQRPDGNLIVEGRAKDMINRGGEKISAEEVEDFAYQVEGVSMAAAVAMPDPDLGERVCLYVVPRAECQIRLGDIQAVMMREGVAKFKLPERLVLVESMPSTNVGKIDKKALRADLQQRLT